MQKLSQTQNNMKTKIQEALKNKYRNLGFSDKVFEGVADSIQTFIKEEAEIATFVDGAETMLKAFQSTADQLRTEKSLLEKENSELKALKEIKPIEPIVNPTPQPLDVASLTEIMKQIVAPFQQELAEIKLGDKRKATLATAKSLFLTDEIHPDRKALAEIAFETVTSSISEDTTPETIVTKAKEFFNKQCSAVGVSGYKPQDSSEDVKPKSAAQAFVEDQKNNTVSKSKEISKRLGIEEKD